MRKAIDVTLIVGFLIVDFFFFHDIFKIGEVQTLPEILTGLFSIPVIIISLKSLLNK